MPIRNEAAFIARSLGAVLDQDYPADRMQVLVADGMSDDATRATRSHEIPAARANNIKPVPISKAR